MKKRAEEKDEVVVCVNCITGKTEAISFRDHAVKHIAEAENEENNLLFTGPGLIDLQINGINGIDFNDPSLTREDIIRATHYLLSQGITTFLPTVITNSDENTLKIVRAIYNACQSDPLVNDCIWGIHLEGPFISPVPGARGAHDANYIKPPDWKLFKRIREAAGGKIKLVTLAPEWEGSDAFIKECKSQGILVSIGHSMANTEQIAGAIKAGASLSTHLGNAVPLLLPRHPNIIWDQLAAGELYACIIADGIHIPDSFIKAVMKIKGRMTIATSDATRFTGMAPGEYHSHIGDTVLLDEHKRISLKNTPGLLAGAAKSLLENVECLLDHQLSTIGGAWQMASQNVADMLSANDAAFYQPDDRVIFQVIENRIQIMRVIKSRKVVFEKRPPYQN